MQVVMYCDETCQRAHWPTHEHLCKDLRAAKECGQIKKCGLCGFKDGPLKKTPCCDHWICDDEKQYVLLSKDRNCCSRNHTR
jgi:hypothetical protein